ncbi:putative short-chain dehydrogenase [Annulohypoxylon maeteangense]|uniref:putative short-chain dehydrogenase n=1 Tax=Annulohypoxylon maeteangense TaxID=1927788 RepID=UPI002007BB20|nr:putative short-chain dehydrogenase [Annulohypoxylon maeteangense]KAI0886389.1 putative short-chain dehydrogenase [Annulohypoxylon maeteangense]
MSGTVILTGANSSVGLHAVNHLLEDYPQSTAILTVRNATDSDVNTNSLRSIVSQYSNARVSIVEVDLSDLSAVHKFADNLSASIAAGEYPPLEAIICNAFYWNLIADPQLSIDGYEITMQVGHISHSALVLRLLDRFGPDGGRVETLSSIAHYRRKNSMTQFPPEIPSDLNQLVVPPPNEDKQGWGSHLYGTSKLIITIWTYALNRYLQNDPKLSNITAVAINPGNLMDSRAYRTNTPTSLRVMARYLMQPLLPFIRRFLDNQFRPSSAAAIDIIDLGLGKAHAGERGYFTLLDKDEPDSAALDEEIQNQIWAKSMEWAKITKDNCSLTAAFG